jgi:hypothetical protein
MISSYDNCLFIHIPKTAGQSIETVFLQRAGLDWHNREQFLLRENSEPHLGPPRLAHLTATEYLELGYLDSETFTQMFKFSVVRNPWDRLVSEYIYQQYPFSFKDFIFKHFPPEGQDDYDKHHGHYRHVMPQWKFVCDNDGTLLVDAIMKFESLQQDFNKVSLAITGQKITLPHRNKTVPTTLAAKLKSTAKKLIAGASANKALYTEYYDEESKAWVANYYAKDITMFGYSFKDK